jgi:ribosomal protein L14
MIRRETIVKVDDNTGVRSALCIGFLKSIKANSIGNGDVLRVCIKKVNRKKFERPKKKGKIKTIRKNRREISNKVINYIFYAILLTTKKP